MSYCGKQQCLIFNKSNSGWKILLSVMFASLAPTMSATVALVVIFAGAYVAYQLFFSPLSRIPGPFWAKVSEIRLLLGALGDEANRDFVSLHKKYGKVVRIGPKTL